MQPGATNWLDTETKAILYKEPEQKPAPSKAGEFALVLLKRGTDEQRLIAAIQRINGSSEEAAQAIEQADLPVTINAGLTEEEALFGQFELICCDAIAAFIRSEVLRGQDWKNYLLRLFLKISESPEFQPTRIHGVEIPGTEAGERFIEQFLGRAAVKKGKAVRISVSVPYKKARIMKHWARRLGVEIPVNELIR